MIVMKDGSDLQKILNSVLAGMRELEQENMDKEDENARLLQQLLVAREDTYVAIDAERLRAWKENKAFQYDLAEENAELRKKVTEKHDDNARLQRQLALKEKHLQDAYKSLEDLEQSTLSAQSRMSNAEVKVDDLTEENAILRRQVESSAWHRTPASAALELQIYEDDVYKRQHDEMFAISRRQVAEQDTELQDAYKSPSEFSGEELGMMVYRSLQLPSLVHRMDSLEEQIERIQRNKPK